MLFSFALWGVQSNPRRREPLRDSDHVVFGETCPICKGFFGAKPVVFRYCGAGMPTISTLLEHLESSKLPKSSDRASSLTD